MSQHFEPEIIVAVVDQTLTDGSVVHDVAINDRLGGKRIVFSGVDEEAACRLGEILHDAINEHTVNTVGLVRV